MDMSEVKRLCGFSAAIEALEELGVKPVYASQRPDSLYNDFYGGELSGWSAGMMPNQLVPNGYLSYPPIVVKYRHRYLSFRHSQDARVWYVTWNDGVRSMVVGSGEPKFSPVELGTLVSC